MHLNTQSCCKLSCIIAIMTTRNMIPKKQTTGRKNKQVPPVGGELLEGSAKTEQTQQNKEVRTENREINNRYLGQEGRIRSDISICLPLWMFMMIIMQS